MIELIVLNVVIAVGIFLIIEEEKNISEKRIAEIKKLYNDESRN